MIVTRNYIILIIGGVLLLGGYTLFEIGSSFMTVEWRDTNIIFKDEVSIQPAENFSTSHTLEDYIMLNVDLQSFPPDNLIKVQIFDDRGLSILDIKFKKKLVTNFITNSSGLYNIMISNLDKEQTLIKIELQDVPFKGQKGVFGFGIQMKTGLIMMGGGVIGLAIGSFVFLYDRKKKNYD